MHNPSRVRAARVYIYALFAVAVLSLVSWLYFLGFSFDWEALGASGILALVCAISRRFPIAFGRVTVEVVDVAILATLVLLGPIWALAVAAPSVLYRDSLRAVFVASTQLVCILAAGYVFQLFAEPVMFTPSFGASVAYGTLAAGTVYYITESLVNSGLIRLKYGTQVVHTLRESFLPLVPSDVMAMLSALGTAYALVVFGPAMALVLFLGTTGALVSLYLIHGRQKENEALKAERASLLDSNLVFASRLVESLGMKDGYTARHAAASAVYATDVATELGLESSNLEKLKVAALLQNVGLVSVPDEVLLTPPAKLNSVGKASLKNHPIQGEHILSSVPEFEEAASWVRWHHERPDGTGYPDRLRSEWIPTEAKVLAISELYTSLILDSPHSPSLSPLEARRELVNLAGAGLDREIVRVFLRVLDTQDSNYTAAVDDRFTFPSSSVLREASIENSHLHRPTGTTEAQ